MLIKKTDKLNDFSQLQNVYGNRNKYNMYV